MKRIEEAVAGIANLKTDSPSYREGQWQAFLSRGGTGVFKAIEMAASGARLGELLSTNRLEVDASTLNREQGNPPLWQFITSAPTQKRPVSESMVASSDAPDVD